MSAISLSTSVNRHYLSKLMKLTEVMDVAASEDIYDARGMKLVAKGARLTLAQQDTLGSHKLKKTLESSLSAEGGADTGLIVATASRVLDASVPLRRILGTSAGSGNGNGAGASPLAILGNMRFDPAMRMMLTLTDRDMPQALEHSVTVALLSIGMARKLKLSQDEQMVAGLAGLLHDIGELYIDPAYLAPGKRLLPHEWAHLVVHPRIGQMLINELASYPVAVARAVAEHHERLDGTGYPRQLPGTQISATGQAVSVAEMLAGLLHKDYPLERAELALKIIPGEHSHDLLSAISGAMHAEPAGHSAQAHVAPDDVVGKLHSQICAALETGRALAASPHTAPRPRELVERTVDRIRTIQRAFISTGLDFYLNHNHGLAGDDGALLFEKAVATREITWRLRDIARDLALHTAASPPDTLLFAGLIQTLDGAVPAPAASAA